jgi:TRAP transporter TAXI family solute receptor
MGEVVKAVLKPYGWDVQICYTCAGGPRAARLVSQKAIATARRNPSLTDPSIPKGPIDFGATGVEYLQWAYLGINDFAKDQGSAHKQLRAIANIQEPSYYIVAVKTGSGITDLRQIVEKRLPAKMVAKMQGGEITPMVMEYYGISMERLVSFGGTFDWDRVSNSARDKDMDVLIGWGAPVNAPEYAIWNWASQKFDLQFLELPPDLRTKLIKQFHLEERKMPPGLFRGIDKPISTVARNGTVVYGRTDMPEDFAYILAKALDEHQELLTWTHMNWSYNRHTVWKPLDVPLHPGAARYYKERGYMK